MSNARNQAFTFVEVALVLLIVTLLLGAIFTYRSFQDTSRLRSIISDSSNYLSAISDFRSKYYNLPGDMPNAFDYFTACGGNDYTFNDGCNGDGDHFVDWNNKEGVKAWELLAKDGFIGGAYSGVCGSTCEGYIESNMPGSNFAGIGYYIDAYNMRLNMLMAGKEGLEANDPNTPFLTATETKSIDAKVDDGSPLSGDVRAIEGTPGDCYTGTGNGTYNNSETPEACAIGFTF